MELGWCVRIGMGGIGGVGRADGCVPPLTPERGRAGGSFRGAPARLGVSSKIPLTVSARTHGPSVPFRTKSSTRSHPSAASCLTCFGVSGPVSDPAKLQYHSADMLIQTRQGETLPSTRNRPSNAENDIRDVISLSQAPSLSLSDVRVF